MAFLRDGDRSEPVFNVPVSVTALIAALVLAHVARMFLLPEASEHALVDYGFIPLRVAHASVTPGGLVGQALPFVSYIFLHGDLMHLGMNCLWLLAFGPIVARRFGAILFLLFFLVCGVAGAVAYLSLNWLSPVPVIGASGAISGLMAAGIRMLRPASPVVAFRGRLAPVFSRQVVVFSLFWVVINLAFGLTGLTIGGETGQLAWQAHLGGYFAGLLLAGPFDFAAGNAGSGESWPA
jgi:membrane associated rhomboid family serine protease